MKHRAWIVAASLLTILAVLAVLRLLESDDFGPRLTLTSPAVSSLADAPSITNPFGADAALPKELSGETFEKMMAAFSEPDGYFMYDNYLSNERSYQDPIP